MADQSLDARRIAREQESRVAAATIVGFNAARPLFQYHTSMLRLWADNLVLAPYARPAPKGTTRYE